MKLNVGCGKDVKAGWVNLDSKVIDGAMLGDVHNLQFKDDYFSDVQALSVLEHVKDPQRAVDEMWRVLEYTGILTLRVPFMWVYHGSPDYWRFTEEGLRLLLHKFDVVAIKQEQGFFDIFINLIPKLEFLRGVAKRLNKMFKSKSCTLYWVTAVK